MLLKDKLSKVYHTLIAPEILDISIPEEQLADCANCHSCISDKLPHFNTKCCTYHPVIPNYMIGAILLDDNPSLDEGRRRLLSILEKGHGVTPLGIIPPLKHHILYTANVQPNKITYSADVANQLKCPFYNQGSCSIWSHRTELCSTYFCFSTGGVKGKQFWGEFHHLFTGIEHGLSIYALNEMNYPIHSFPINEFAPDKLKLDSEQGALDKKKYSKIWKEWQGQEITFFKNCYEAVASLSSKEVEQLFGFKEALQIKKVKALAKIFNENVIPDYLVFRAGEANIQKTNNNYTIILSKKTLEMTSLQLMYLNMFNGKHSTYDIIRKSEVLKQGIYSMISPLMEEGLLINKDKSTLRSV
jgi:Fe-S-cluster containining protein